MDDDLVWGKKALDRLPAVQIHDLAIHGSDIKER